MKFQIRNRWTNDCQWEGDIPDDTAESERIKIALAKAISEHANLQSADLYGANLYGANLRGANLQRADLQRADLQSADLYGANLQSAHLRSADLYGANLYGANLQSAHLRSADLYGANLQRADLQSADLYGANLRSADLYGANLYGADLRGANLQIGKAAHKVVDLLQIGPIGSRRDWLIIWRCEDGVFVIAGCFTGTRKKFAAQVKKTHGNNEHAKAYAAALKLADAMWPSKRKGKGE